MMDVVWVCIRGTTRRRIYTGREYGSLLAGWELELKIGLLVFVDTRCICISGVCLYTVSRGGSPFVSGKAPSCTHKTLSKALCVLAALFAVLVWQTERPPHGGLWPFGSETAADMHANPVADDGSSIHVLLPIR